MDNIEAIKQSLNIVDFISEYLPLKKAGINYKTNCPFHQEKTPSFVVSPDRQIWHCFGCQKGGDIFKFLMEKEGVEFKEALEILAQKAGIVLQKIEPKKDIKEKLFEVNLKAQQFYHHILTTHPLGKKALEYLKNRGLTKESIEQFGIGYAPNSWEGLSKFLLKRGFSTTELIDSGLAVASARGCYDRFRGRITFPLIDTKGKIIGFSGRVLDSSEPKYINTPQTIIFDKSNYLFGINLSKGEIKIKNEAILVEGEMDMVLSFQAGFKNIVASKGTALTSGQIDLIKRFTENISLCFDMDLAGDSASRRGIEMAEKAGLNIKVIKILEGKDPAEAIKSDPKIWQQAIEEALPIYDYYLQSVAKRFDPKKPADLKNMAAELVPIWAKINDDLVKERYTQKLAALLLVSEDVLRKSIEKAREGYKPSIQAVKPSVVDDQIVLPSSRRELLEKYIIILLLHIPKNHTYVPTFPETLFLTENLKQIYVMLVLYLDSISFKAISFEINNFIKSLPKELSLETDQLYLTEVDDKLTNAQQWQKEVVGVVVELKKALIKASLEKLSYEIKSAQEFGKMDVMERLNKRFRDLSVKLKNL